MKTKLQIRDIVEETGLDRETLRFYEQKGLLPRPERTESGYRLFDADVIVRLKFIKMAQEVGFTLREISELLNLGESKSVSRADLKKIADEKITQLDDRIRSLTSMRKILVDLSKRSAATTTKSTCPILSQFKKLEF